MSLEQLRNLIFGRSFAAATAAVAIAFVLTVVVRQPVQAQTFQEIHNFDRSGYAPYAGLTYRAHNLYGTAYKGGYTGGACGPIQGCGTVYQLKQSGSGWIFNILFSFNFDDGLNPVARVVFGPNGTLYGTTSAGGSGGGGTVFNLAPPPTPCKAILCPWNETVLHSFTGNSDGSGPGYGDLIFDRAGNIYGTTSYGGDPACSCGTVYELSPSGGGWKEKILYSFLGIPGDGEFPVSGVVPDDAGNLYGTTVGGGPANAGTIYKLSPSGSGWTETVLYSFNGSDGAGATAGVILDKSGNLYGATTYRGSGGGGTVFELIPSDGNWTLKTLYSFTGNPDDNCGPVNSLVMDGAGALYGTTSCDGAYGYGSAFKLTPSDNGEWTLTDLHDFCAGGYPCPDGATSYGGVEFDPNGNLYGTTTDGGTYGVGVAWEITP